MKVHHLFKISKKNIKYYYGNMEKQLRNATWKISRINSKEILHIYYGWTQKEHIFYSVDSFAACSVKNCEITYEDKALNTADLVIFHLHRMINGEIPNRTSTEQIWAFLTDESPYHTFMQPNKLENYNGLFNWSMTYR